MSENQPSEREYLEGLRYEDKFPDDGENGTLVHISDEAVDMVLCLLPGETLTDDEREAVRIHLGLLAAEARGNLDRIAELEHQADLLGRRIRVAVSGRTVSCRKCGQPIEGDGFGSPETGWEHPFTCPHLGREDPQPT